MAITSTPSFVLSLDAYVPFPEPGAPKIIAFTFARILQSAVVYEEKRRVIKFCAFSVMLNGNVYGG
jgi:hypothetical protein